MKGKNNSNIASSWPIIVNENALNEASILPHLLHEANEQAQQEVIETMEENGLLKINVFNPLNIFRGSLR